MLSSHLQSDPKVNINISPVKYTEDGSRHFPITPKEVVDDKSEPEIAFKLGHAAHELSADREVAKVLAAAGTPDPKGSPTPQVEMKKSALSSTKDVLQTSRLNKTQTDFKNMPPVADSGKESLGLPISNNLREPSKQSSRRPSKRIRLQVERGSPQFVVEGYGKSPYFKDKGQSPLQMSPMSDKAKNDPLDSR